MTVDNAIRCIQCPRSCKADRKQANGFCRAGNEIEVSAVCRHTGEEPPLSGKKGICNIFFAHCNLQCIYCQNYEISHREVNHRHIFYQGIDAVVEKISEVLPTTENIIGLVSATHYAHQIPILVEALHRRGLYPTVVYNCGGYESVETLRMLAPYIDIYLPDYKYSDTRLATRYSQAADYPERAQAALQEMYRQKGSALRIDDTGVAFGGIIIRHLVLPGSINNTKRCIEWIAENLSTAVHISLMAQYFPTEKVIRSTHLDAESPLRRTLTAAEYEEAVTYLRQMGFYRGWVQPLESADNYHPHFDFEDPFGNATDKKQ